MDQNQGRYVSQRGQEKSRLIEAIRDLSENERLALLLRYTQDMNPAEIAAVLHSETQYVDEGMARSMLSSAMQKVENYTPPAL